MSEAELSYYNERPVERLERSVDGIKSIIRLLETREDAFDQLHALLEIVADDMQTGVEAIREKLPTD